MRYESSLCIGYVREVFLRWIHVGLAPLHRIRTNFDSSSRVRVFGPDGVVCTSDGFSIFGVFNVCKGEE